MKARTLLIALVPPTALVSLLGYFFSTWGGTEAPEAEPGVPAAVESIEPSEGTPAKESSSGADSEKKKTGEADLSSVQNERDVEVIQVPERNVSETSSDYYYRILTSNAASLSQNELWLKFANTEGCLLTLVKAVDQLSNGNRPLAIGDFSFLGIRAPFSAVKNEAGEYVLSPETEGRYNDILEAIFSVSTPNVNDLLKYLEPELDRIVHEELGYPEDVKFRVMLKEALNHVLETPLQEKPAVLIKLTDRLYKYQDEALEELSAAQKFMLRLGPVNQRKLFEYLGKIRDNV